MKTSHAAVASFLLLALLAGVSRAAPAPSPLRREAGTFLDVLDSLNASILTIVAVPELSNAPPNAKRKRLIGTGVATSDRVIVTTASLAFRKAGSVRVLLGEGVERSANLRGVDRQSNIAVFQIDQPVLNPLRRAPPQSLAVGAWVAIITNVGITRPQAAIGRVVGRGERVDFPYSGDVIEIDAPTYPGSAGGAVMNEDGEWVALVVGRGMQVPHGSERVALPEAPVPGPGSVLLAVPVDQVDRIAKDLVEHGAVQRGYLGIRLKRSVGAADTLGVRVDGVVDESPAARAGIREGDRILAFEGQELRAPEDLSLLVASMRPGDEVEMTILRDTEILPFKLVLGSTPSAETPTKP
jgi:serine protease Do